MNKNEKKILTNFVQNDNVKKLALRLIKVVNFGLNTVESIRNIEFNSRFDNQIKFLNKKNVPNSEIYPYKVHDEENVFKDGKNYQNYFLVGDNWLEENSTKPIALMVGFNDWKYGFVADYMKEYRVVFAQRKLRWISTKLNPKPDVIVVWGYTENRFIRRYSKNKNIPLYRMEDGFVRSALLGASHATPYSLILDKKGLYYNPTTETDLEHILNNYDFNEDKNLLDEAKNSLKLIVDMKISKYNIPVTKTIDKIGIKMKKRVVVLGQVDADAAIVYGNPDKWTSEDLVKLAKIENPESEILYRPHPEVYNGYQKSKFKQKNIEHFAKVVSPDEPLMDFLETIDHVYVVNSLSGLEALLRGIKVTTVGKAFYAGWGLTDDRCKFERRERKLSLTELFAGIYLKYPMYLADLDNSTIGLKAACYRIRADYKISEYEKYKSLGMKNTNILSSKFWVQLILTKKISNKQLDNIFKKIDFSIYLKKETSVFFQKVYLLSIFGLLNSDSQKSMFLNKIRTHIDFNVYDEFLNIIINFYDEDIILKEVVWLLSQVGKNNVSTKLLELFNNKDDSFFEKTVEHENEETNQITKKILSSNIKKNIYNLYEHHMINKEFDKAMELAELMLIHGLHTESMIHKLIVYAKLKFDFKSAIQLGELQENMNLFIKNRNMTLEKAMSYGTKEIENIGEENFTNNLMELITIKSNAIASASFIVNKYKSGNDKDNLIELLEKSLYLDNDQSIRKAQAFIAIDKAEKAVKILENLIEKEKQVPTLICTYTQALSFSGELEKAIKHIERVLIQYPDRSIYHEAIRLFILNSSYDKCLNILELAAKNNIEIGEMHRRKTYFGNRMPGKALETFKEIPIKKVILTKYYSDKYIYNPSKVTKKEKVILLSVYGPGDEIRFASIYSRVIDIFKAKKIFITCSQKLYNIFVRSFPNITFVSTARIRASDEIDTNNYNKIKGSDLIQLIDNNAHKYIEKSDKLMIVTDLLGDTIKDYSDFDGESYFVDDKEKTSFFKTLLPKKTTLVGLSWRSSITTHSRTEHYLTIDELAPLLELDNVTFVNFQYDECANDLAWIEENYPGKMIDIEEVDHFDDLDSVASLMKCMDLIITPATTVVELSGALGCPTWLFSNSSELDWRIIDDKGTDVWHNSIKIVEGDEVGDKKSLVINLRDKLKSFLEDKNVK